MQTTSPNPDLLNMMEIFRNMINHCIRISIENNNCSNLKKLSQLAYHELNKYDVMSSYKLNAISQACGRISQMKRSIRRGIKTRTPYVRKPYLINCYGFKINGKLLTIQYKPRQPINILLNDYTVEVLSSDDDTSLKIRSFTLTRNSLSICYSREVKEIQCANTIGIDRNLRNVTVGNSNKVTFYKTAKLLNITENTSHVRSTFKRNDARIRKKLSSKLGTRQKNRTRQLIHKISKDIVQNAVQTKSMIVFENLKGIRKLYRKGNGQGRKYRRRLNGWSFYELQRQVQYKAVWEGIPVRFVDPRCTSKLCPRCGKRLQEDRANRRKLWCSNCMQLMDRDVVAAMNIAYKGWLWHIHPRGDTGEAMVQEPDSDFLKKKEAVILKVDVSKLLVVNELRQCRHN